MWHGWLAQPWRMARGAAHGWASQPCHTAIRALNTYIHGGLNMRILRWQAHGARRTSPPAKCGRHVALAYGCGWSRTAAVAGPGEARSNVPAMRSALTE